MGKKTLPGDRRFGGGPSRGHRQHAQKLVKIAQVVPDTQTDILITILRNRSRGQSNDVSSKANEQIVQQQD